MRPGSSTHPRQRSSRAPSTASPSLRVSTLTSRKPKLRAKRCPHSLAPTRAIPRGVPAMARDQRHRSLRRQRSHGQQKRRATRCPRQPVVGRGSTTSRPRCGSRPSLTRTASAARVGAVPKDKHSSLRCTLRISRPRFAWSPPALS